MLSLVELERAARVVAQRFTGARLDKIVQPDGWRVVLVAYVSRRSAAHSDGSPEGGGGGRHTLVLCARPEQARVAELEQAPPAPETPPPFARFLRKRLLGARIAGCGLRSGDRQLALRLRAGEQEFELLLSLLGRRSNLYLLDGAGILLRALRPLGETRPELAVGEAWRDPGSSPPQRGRDRFGDIEDDRLLAAIERHYAERERDSQSSDLRRRLTTALAREEKLRRRRLEKIEAELAEAEKASEIQRHGELLKGSLAQVRPGMSQIRVRDYESGEEVEIPLDPKLGPQQNLEATFKRYQKLIRRLSKAGGQVDEAQQRVREIEAWRSELDALAPDDDEAVAALAEREGVADVLERQSPAERPKGPAPRRDATAPIGPFKDVPRRLHPRRYRSADGLEIWVGRHDEGNDFLSTRLARGKDLFFHLEGAPGSHVVLRTEGRDDPPSESLLDACELAVHFSKAKRASRADVHIVPIKNVKKPKGAKRGLVYVTGGRTLHLRRDEARLARVLASRIPD